MLRTTGAAIARIAAITALASGALMVSGASALAATTAQTSATVVTGGHADRDHKCDCYKKHKKHDKCKAAKPNTGNESTGGDAKADGKADSVVYCFGGGCTTNTQNIPGAGGGGGGAITGNAITVDGWPVKG